MVTDRNISKDNSTRIDAHMIAYFLIVAILALLIWTLIELKKGDKRLAAHLAEMKNKD